MYGKDDEFKDPVVRCECGTLLQTETLLTMGSCSNCGGRKVRNVLRLKDGEMEQMRKWSIDQKFLDLFEPAPAVVPAPKVYEEPVTDDGGVHNDE